MSSIAGIEMGIAWRAAMAIGDCWRPPQAGWRTAQRLWSEALYPQPKTEDTVEREVTVYDVNGVLERRYDYLVSRFS